MRQKHKFLSGAAAILLMLLVVGLPNSFGQSVDAEQIVLDFEGDNGGTRVVPDAPSATMSAQFSSSRPHAGEIGQLEFPRPDISSRANERMSKFLENSVSPAALRGNLIDAVQAHFEKAWPGYGRGFSGFEKRYFAVTADHVENNFFGTYLFPTLLHQNPRSQRLGSGSVWHRLGYAVSRVAVTNDDSGRPAFNSSFLLSTLASSAIKNLYYPERQRGFSATMGRIQGSLLDNVQGNLTREFLPDVERYLWKHAPAGLQRIAQRLPMSRKWQPEMF
jgi:hypothetical protein